MGLSAKKDADLGKHTRDQTDSESDTDSDSGTKRSKRKKKPAKKSRREEKLERIDKIIDELKTKHGSEYTDIQYRVWAESFDTRYHQSLDSPPQGSIFKSQGRKSKSSTADRPCSTSDSPRPTGDPPHGMELTPQKAAHLKSTYSKSRNCIPYRQWVLSAMRTSSNKGTYFWLKCQKCNHFVYAYM